MEAEPTISDASNRKRRVQYRLRTLMIVVTFLAVACAYVGWQAKVVRERNAWLEMHQQEYFPFSGPWGVIFQGDRAQSPSRFRLLIGDTPQLRIIVSKTASRADKELAASLFPEADVLDWP
jgi:hypothetical protein